MKYKKIFRFISLLLAVFTLVISVPATVYAADASDVNGIEDSEVVDDLVKMGFDTTKYKLDSSADYVTVIDFLEYGYDYYGDTSRYGLYLYLYNPSGKALDVYSARNKASLQCVINKVGIGFSNYRLVYLDSSEDNLLYKFKINIPQSYMLKPSKAERQYEIGDIELKYEGEDHKSFDAGGSWIYKGYQAYCGVDRTKDTSTLSYEAKELITLKINLNPVSWLSAASDVGYEFRYEVFGAYFSVPNYIIEEYGDKNDATKGLYSIDGVYTQYDVDGLITSNSQFYETAKTYAGVDNRYSDIPFGFHTHPQNSFWTDDQFSYNGKKYWQIDNTSYEELGRELNEYDVAFFLTLQEVEDEKTFANLLQEYLQDYTVNKSDKVGKENSKFSVKADSGDMSKQILTFANTHGYNFWYYLSGKAYLWDELHNISYGNLDPIRYLTSSDVDYLAKGTDTVMSDLYVDESYLSSLKTFVDTATSNKETTFLFRYDIEDYFCGDIKIAQSGAGNDIAFGNSNYYFQKTVYDGLDVLSLTWKDEHGGVKTIPVSATSITNVGVFTKPDELDEPFKDMFGGTKSKLDDFLDSLTPLSIILGITIFVVIYYLWNLWFSPKAIERSSNQASKERIERYKAKQNAKAEYKSRKKTGGKK